MNLFEKFKETVNSVLPVMAIVVLLGITFAPLGVGLIVRFLIGGIFVILGLTLFLLGVDVGITPIGELTGAAITSRRNLSFMLIIAFVIGFMVTVAEPDVQVLADQIKGVNPFVNKWVLIGMIAVGIGLFTMIGLVRTVLSLNLKIILTISYVTVFVLAFLCSKNFQGVAFDAGGATTGPMTVPFIMALGVGVAAVRSRGRSAPGSQIEGGDSFGLTGIASIGPVAAVCIYGIVTRFMGLGQSNALPVENSVDISNKVLDSGLDLGIFIRLLPEVFKEVSMALLPLVIMFILFQIFLLKMPPFQVKRMFRGVIYSYIGLIVFLLGANGGFMPAGDALGTILGRNALVGQWSKVLIVVVGMIFGAIVVCAEPAVWVLTEQVEHVSGGTIRRRVMLVALSAGVAVSIGISMLRVLYGFSLWYVLIPGYGLALLLSIWCPDLFTGIAFDSGGVASGPMTSTFILSFTLGATGACGGNPATDGFGVIALVSMTPLIAIQILGIIFKKKKSEAK